MMFFDPMWLLFSLPALALMLWAQAPLHLLGKKIVQIFVKRIQRIYFALLNGHNEMAVFAFVN